MKKLLVVALCALMVLSFAVVSMAAVAVSGESNFKWTLGPEGTEDESGDAKVKFTADVSDTMQIVTVLKGGTGASDVNVDEAWASFKADTITTKVGFFGFNLDGDVDIIPSLNELKHDAGISVSAKAADAITVAGYLARFGALDADGDWGWQQDYAFSVAYDTDSFGGKLAYSATSIEETAGILSLSGYYKMDAFKAYLTYESIGEQLGVDIGSNAVLGAMYDSDTIYGRLEIQVVQTELQADAEVGANQGFRVGYKINPNAKVEYNTKTIGDLDPESSIKLCVTF